MYKLICFDLDDTLWPCMPTIERAEKTLYDWLDQQYPVITQSYTPQQLRDKRKALLKTQPELQHDLSAARRVHLQQLADEFDLSSSWVEPAFEVFYQARQQVQLFDDVLPVLDALRQDFTLVALTNGNAHIRHTGLAEQFDFQLSAADVQASKPHPAMFVKAMQQVGVAPRQTLHVGDHPLHDIQGARNAGIDAVWLRRFAQPWDDQFAEPAQAFSSLHALQHWLQSSIAGK